MRLYLIFTDFQCDSLFYIRRHFRTFNSDITVLFCILCFTVHIAV